MDVLDIAAVLTHYGAETVPEGGWRSMRCPFHDDRVASARVSTEKGAFFCNGCGMKGDCIGLIRKVEKCDFHRAVDFYTRISGDRDGTLRFSTGRKSRRGISTSERDWERGAGLLPDGVRRRGIGRR